MATKATNREPACRECGRTAPPCGFYPTLWSGGMNLRTGEVKGGLLCHDCDKALRAGQPIEKADAP